MLVSLLSPLLAAAEYSNDPAPTWIPVVAFAVPALIVLSVLIPAMRTRRRYRAARAHQLGARREEDTPLGSAESIADPAEYSVDALLRAMAIAEPEFGDAENGPFNEGWAGNMLGLKARPAPASEVMEPTVYYGERHGRQVFVRFGPDEKLQGSTTMLTSRHVRQIAVLRVESPVFELAAPGGRVTAGAGATPELDGVLASLPASEAVWSDMRGYAGPEGIVLHRPAITSPGHWVYDLWLAERIADALRLEPLAKKRIGPAWTVPYGLGRRDRPAARG